MEFSFKNHNSQFFEKPCDDKTYYNDHNNMDNNKNYSYKNKIIKPLRLNNDPNRKFGNYSDSDEEKK